MLDEKTSKLVRLLNEQFDLEILYKQRELKRITDEIKKGKEILDALEQVTLTEEQPRLSGPKRVYEIKPDGSYVMLKCCFCDREKFASLLGFTNHCRISHKHVFMSPEERVRRCGVDVSEEEVPDEFKLRPERNIQYERGLSQLRSGIKQSPLNRKPKIKEFEDSYKGLSGERNYEDENEESNAESDEEIEGTQEKEGAERPKEEEKKEETKGKEKKRIPNGILSPTPLKKIKTELKSENTHFKNEFIISNDAISRFHVKRKIVVGNIAKYIEKDGGNSKFKWKVYIRGSSDNPHLETFISKIRVFLHPTYENNIVDLEFPFKIVREGWGEFPIRLKLFFVDERNKPTDLIYQLKLDGPLSGSYTLGSEKVYNIDLDKNTEFGEPKEIEPQDHLKKLKLVKEKRIQEEQERVFREAVTRFPLIGDSKEYRCARSETEFGKWMIGKQLSSEYRRSVYVSEYCAVRGLGLSPKECKWKARELGFTPRMKKSVLSTKCLVCGLQLRTFNEYSDHKCNFSTQNETEWNKIKNDTFSLNENSSLESALSTVSVAKLPVGSQELVIQDELSIIPCPYTIQVGSHVDQYGFNCTDQSNVLLSQIANLFIKNLILKASKKRARNCELTPVHLYETLKEPEYDFVTNSNLGNKEEI